MGEFREVESGKRHKNRPELLAALEQAVQSLCRASIRATSSERDELDLVL